MGRKFPEFSFVSSSFFTHNKLTSFARCLQVFASFICFPSACLTLSIRILLKIELACSFFLNNKWKCKFWKKSHSPKQFTRQTHKYSNNFISKWINWSHNFYGQIPYGLHRIVAMLKGFGRTRAKHTQNGDEKKRQTCIKSGQKPKQFCVNNANIYTNYDVIWWESYRATATRIDSLGGSGWRLKSETCLGCWRASCANHVRTGRMRNNFPFLPIKVDISDWTI